MMRIRGATLAAAMLLLSGCDDDEPSGPGGPAVDCSDEVTHVDVTVTTGDDVRFDWSPRCRVAYFGVEAEDGDRWWIGDDETENRITPPLTYGVEPDGFEEEEEALPLIEGESYTVVLWIIGDEGEYLAAVEPFTR